MKTLCSYVTNTRPNSARQVEHKSSHSVMQLMQQPPRALREFPVNYKAPLSGSYYCLHILHNENRLFLSCRSWWTYSTLTPVAPFSDGAAGVRVRGLYGPLESAAPL